MSSFLKTKGLNHLPLSSPISGAFKFSLLSNVFFLVANLQTTGEKNKRN